MTPIYTGQNKLTPIYTPKQNEEKERALAEAIERHQQEKAKREPMLADQGKMEGGLDKPKI